MCPDAGIVTLAADRVMCMRITYVIAFMLVSAAMSGQVIFPPSVIDGRTDCPGRTVIYPEGFVAERGSVLSISGAREAVAADTLCTVELCSGTSSASVPLHVVMTDPDALPHDVYARVLCFGESTTAMRCSNPYDPQENAKNWVMLAAEDLPPGVELTGNIGHGGWATYTYLNWPCAAKLDPHAPDTFFKPETMWYALGLKTVVGEDYTGSVEQLSLMAVTPFGKNAMDGSESLWKLVQKLGSADGYPAFPFEEDYVGSRKQNRHLRAWARELMDNPINEFYDRKTAKKGSHAFSLPAYLERTGEKCPTHVVINIGINDGDGANSMESSRICFEKLVRCFDGIPVAHFVNRWPGVCDKSLWENCIARQYDVNGNTHNLLRLQKVWREVAEQHGNVYELDVWHCQYPASQLGEKFTGDGELDCSLNDVHTGYMGEVSSAWQVVCWLYHLLSR